MGIIEFFVWLLNKTPLAKMGDWHWWEGHPGLLLILLVLGAIATPVLCAMSMFDGVSSARRMFTDRLEKEKFDKLERK